MPTTLIFGGSGKVARHITRQLVALKHDVHSVIRNPSQTSDLEALGAKPIVQSIEDSSVSDLTATIRSLSPSTIVWAAGAGGGNAERTKTVDQEGAIKVFDAAAAAGVKRLITVSALDVRDREGKPEPEWYNDADRSTSKRMWGVIGPYMQAKYTADRNLVEENGRRGLKYTIVRPGGLTTNDGTGKVDAGKVHLKETIAREDVAAVVVACMQNDETIGMAFDVVGGDVPIEEAIKQVVKDKADTFQGRH